MLLFVLSITGLPVKEKLGGEGVWNEVRERMGGPLFRMGGVERMERGDICSAVLCRASVIQ